MITLLTDFGDFYPGVMKGVILSINPNAKIVDITHNVEPQNVLQGAFLLYHSYRYFKSAIHVAVVDPGVGSKRRALAVFTKNHVFIAPDNGICYQSAAKDGIKKIFRIDESISSLVGELSYTFHGRDVFSPAAALISLQRYDFLEEIKEMEKLDIYDFKIGEKIKCKVVYVDKFGNLITNFPKEFVKAKGYICRGVKFPLVRTYSEVEVGETLALINSFNTLELSVRNGSAAELLGIKRGNVEIELEVFL
ncbi:MAG: S-adenosyl-l-methionine hydroxide adenosyltransferase family protein [Archaeoglobaceae archaeon]|nr:S-adenosyl-l-methionine hydroxide adenosyltransferase family protein [Archaeoglobaceae archaeon]MCX8152147.1 S-adenosyl-l-methionine hydroxide adenosyltransferase family protein [Archaeoglobaceae archaeon]MDW8013863.1 S-adenosyl-l-methionine hydroxide adenosyltransferase family protein [Archaeoglobaceae archaeon]